MAQVKRWPADEHEREVVINHGTEIKAAKAGGKTIIQLAAQYQVDPKIIRQVLHDFWPMWVDEKVVPMSSKQDKAPAAKEEPAKGDAVNHPAHYTRYSREVIELTERCSFCLGNAFKYILRAPFKGRREEDIDKSLWYLNRYFSSAADFSEDPSYENTVVLAMPFILDLMEWKEYELCDYFVAVVGARGAKGAERRKAWLKFKELAEEAKKGIEEEGK